MSNLSGLPPAAIARAASLALSQDIAVRIITLPDALQNNPQPVTLAGVVRERSPDGSLKVETARGLIDMLLKDRGSLQPGQTIEIEIPAGRSPQQAAIRPLATAPPGDPAPHLEIPLNSAAPSVKLDRTQTVKPDDIAEALLTMAPGKALPAAAPLEVGQILRLVPANPPENNARLLNPAQLFALLLQTIGAAVELPLQTRHNMVRILSRVDPAALLPASGEVPAADIQKTVTQAFQKLVQALDLPATLKLQNAAFQNTAAAFFNPARPLDVQILAFENGNFEAVLKAAQAPAAPVINPQNLTVLPEPVRPQVAPAPGPAFLGQVAGFTPQGQPVVSLSVPGSPQPVHYVVQFVTDNLVEGAPLIVTPLPSLNALAKPGFVPFATGAAQPLEDWARPEIWEGLQALIANVSQMSPALGQAIARMLPNAAQPHNMGALGLLFLSLMRSGELEAWVGQPAVNLLKQTGKIDILRALAGESVMAGRLETTLLPNEWRATVFPFWHDNQVNKLPLYFKQWNDEKDADDAREKRDKKMRFMFELRLSRMGPVQVDGFMQTEKLDMILRTRAIVSNNMQEAVRKTYHKAMERSNLSGEITFQFKPEQWVNIEMPVFAS